MIPLYICFMRNPGREAIPFCLRERTHRRRPALLDQDRPPLFPELDSATNKEYGKQYKNIRSFREQLRPEVGHHSLGATYCCGTHRLVLQRKDSPASGCSGPLAESEGHAGRNPAPINRRCWGSVFGEIQRAGIPCRNQPSSRARDLHSGASYNEAPKSLQSPT